MLIWLEDAPVFGVDKDEEVVTYIDSIIICSKFKNDWEILHVVYRQTHRHSYNCRRKSENICRLYNPHHQWDVLRFLIHLMKTHLQFLKKTANNCGKQLKKKPNGFKEGKDITFDELLKKFDVSGHQYILAIRSSLNTPTNTSFWELIIITLLVFGRGEKMCNVYCIIYFQRPKMNELASKWSSMLFAVMT